MINIFNQKTLTRALSLICTVALVFGFIYLPTTLNVKASDPVVVTMDFETDKTTDTVDTSSYSGTSLLFISATAGKDGGRGFYASNAGVDIRSQLVKKADNSVYSLAAGTYNVTYDYKVPTANKQEVYLVYGVTTITGQLLPSAPDANKFYMSGAKLSGENLVKIASAGDKWLKGEVTITVDSDVSHLGFAAITGGKEKPVYIDNVVFTPVKETNITIDFESHTENDNGSSIFNVGDKNSLNYTVLDDTNTSKVLAANFSTLYDGPKKVAEINKNGGRVTIPAGIYTVTYDYYYYAYTASLNPKWENGGFSYKFADGSCSSATAFGDEIVDETKPQNVWNKGEMLVNITKDVNLCVSLNYSPYHIYIDNIKFAPYVPEAEKGAINFENHTEHDLSSIFSINYDPEGTEHGKVFGVSYNSAYDGAKKFVAVRNGRGGCAYNNCSCASTQPITLEAGTYIVTYDYLYSDAIYKDRPGDGNDNYVHPEKFSFKFAYSNSNEALAVPSTVFGEEIVDTSKAKDTWHSGSMTVTLSDGFKHFGFCLEHSPYHIYVDNVKFTPASEEGLINFESHSENDGNSSVFNIGNKATLSNNSLDSTNTSKVLAANFSTYYDGPAKIAEIHENGSQIKIPAGTYKITYDYYYYTFAASLDPKWENGGFSYKFANGTYNSATTFGNEIINVNKSEKVWNKGEMTVTLSKETALCVRLNYSPYHIYLDNIKFTPVEIQDNGVIDFEYHKDNDGGSSIFNVITGKGDNITNVLAANFSSKYFGDEKNCQILRGDNTPVKVPSGFYKLTYDYYYYDFKSDVTELQAKEFSYRFALGSYDECTKLDSEIVDVTKPQNTWHKGEIELYVEEETGLCVSLMYSPYHIYIDNIKFEELPPIEVTISFDTLGGSKIKDVKGNKYQSIVVQSPSKKGYVFAGWFADEACTTPAKMTFMQDCTLYAGWIKQGSLIFDFDKNNKDFKTGKPYSGGVFSIQNDPVGASGKTLGITARFSEHAHGDKRDVMFNNGSVNTVLGKGLYKISYSYYAKYVPVGGYLKHCESFQENAYKNINTATLAFGIVKEFDSTSDSNNRGFTSENLFDLTQVNQSYESKWIKGEVYVAVTQQMIKDGFNKLVLGVSGLPYAVYLDNITIEPMDSNMVMINYTVPDLGYTCSIFGKSGEKIDTSLIKKLNSKYYDISGWYTDEQLTSKFTSNKFPKDHVTLYGKKTIKPEGIKIGFEDYPWKGDTSTTIISLSIMDVVNDGISHDGDGWALKVDNTKATQTVESKGVMLNLESSALGLDVGSEYIIKYHYYIKEAASDKGRVAMQFVTSKPRGIWATQHVLSQTVIKDFKGSIGKWKSGYAGGTVIATDENEAHLQVRIILPLDCVVYFDDFTVTQVPEGKSAIIYSLKTGSDPEPTIVNTNTSVKLRSDISLPDNMILVGWALGGRTLGFEEYLVEQSVNFIGQVTRASVTEDFENYGYDGYREFITGIYGVDDDWQIYDSKAQGGSADNVKSGRYSLRSLGKRPTFKAFNLYMNPNFNDNTLAFTRKYTISMWVKTVNAPHKLGAIEIGNNTTWRNSWALEGERLPIVPIADVADGEWHRVSFTFIATTPYLSIFITGNLEMYFDDITLDYAGDKEITPNAVYDKYIPAFLTADGKYEAPVADSALNEFELVKRTETVTQGGSQLITLITQNVGATIAIIAGAVVLLAGIAVGTIVFIKKRKAKEVK